MRIISGAARNVELLSLPGWEIRPTAIRARKALFDSLGDLTDSRMLDLCSGSGAVALEALSRGAAAAFAVEVDPSHTAIIAQNAEKVRKTGVTAPLKIIQADLLQIPAYGYAAPVDWIFADPPYQESGELFTRLVQNPLFAQKFQGALLVWEIPDFPGAVEPFMTAQFPGEFELRKLGGSRFLFGELTAQ